MNSRGRKGSSAGLAFILSAAASIGLMVTYFLGGQPQAEGVLIGVALGGMAYGLIVWAKELTPEGHFVEEREAHESSPEERADAVGDFEAGQEVVARRGFLAKSLGAAIGALGLAALFPIRSLGSRPGRELYRTSFTEGVPLVTQDGIRVRPENLEVGGILTVFPQGATDAADSQTVLIKVAPGEISGAPEDLVAYSKICTHAGCPVGLYQPTTNQLFCPCHQSAFDVLRGAKPTVGPATRPLPQLPIDIDELGYVIARGDFEEPVGPAFWDLD
ncbi:MAG: Rieske 2Fe-2S domain-containing protein [Actinomycetota bacterium]|nr:Rieske 2Fe-2S domain-containing protein [Actinomycetota bacterium]